MFEDDEEKKRKAQMMIEPQEQTVSPRDLLYKNLTEKYGLDQRNEVQKNSAAPKGFDWRAFGAGVGTSLQGKGAQGATDILNMREKNETSALEGFDKSKKQLTDDIGLADKEIESQSKKDPMSQESKIAQDMAKKMLPSYDFSKMSAEQIESRLPMVSTLFASDSARQMKDMEIGAKANEEKLKKMQEQEKFAKAAGEDQTRKQIYDIIPNEDQQKAAIKELGEFKSAERISNRIVNVLNSAGSDTDLVDRVKGGKVKGEVMKEIEAYMLSAQKQPAETTATIDKVKSFFDMNPNASKKDIQSMALGIIQNLAKTDVLDGYDMRPSFKIQSSSPSTIAPTKSSEVERETSDGKVAIFDAQTKKFLRYK